MNCPAAQLLLAEGAWRSLPLSVRRRCCRCCCCCCTAALPQLQAPQSVCSCPKPCRRCSTCLTLTAQAPSALRRWVLHPARPRARAAATCLSAARAGPGGRAAGAASAHSAARIALASLCMPNHPGPRPTPPLWLQLRRALKILDVDMTQEEVALLISEVDANGDGEVGAGCSGRRPWAANGAVAPASPSGSTGGRRGAGNSSQ